MNAFWLRLRGWIGAIDFAIQLIKIERSRRSFGVDLPGMNCSLGETMWSVTSSKSGAQTVKVQRSFP
jgi:hypothetical protein